MKNDINFSLKDEFEAHKFLESLGETMTVIALRERLREIGIYFNTFQLK